MSFYGFIHPSILLLAFYSRDGRYNVQLGWRWPRSLKIGLPKSLDLFMSVPNLDHSLRFYRTLRGAVSLQGSAE